MKNNRLLTREEYDQAVENMWKRVVELTYADSLRKALNVAFSAALNEVASEAAHMTLYIYGRYDIEQIIAQIRNKADHITTQLFEAEFATWKRNHNVE